jgi:hypothetical protein
MNTVFSQWPAQLSKIQANDDSKTPPGGDKKDDAPPASAQQPPLLVLPAQDDLQLFNGYNELAYDKLYLPYTGNGYIGLAINSKLGLYASQERAKSLSLPLMYNPLVIIYSDNLEKKGNAKRL